MSQKASRHGSYKVYQRLLRDWSRHRQYGELFHKGTRKIRSRFDYAVSSSEATTELLKLEGVAVTELNNCDAPDVYVDGAMKPHCIDN